MTAFNEAWNILKSRFANMKERFENLSSPRRGLNEAKFRVTQADTDDRFGAIRPGQEPKTPEEREMYLQSVRENLSGRQRSHDEDVMSYLVRQQMERNKEQGKISDDADDAFAGL